MTPTRRQRGEGTVHQRPNGTWCGQIDLGYSDGKRRRKTIYAATQEDVIAKMRKLHRQLADHGDLPTSDITVEKWLTYWLTKIAVRRLKPNTYRSYRTAVTKHIVPAIGKRRVGRLTAAHIREMHDYIIDSLELSPTTAHNAHRVLSVALNDGVRDNRLPRNIASIVPAPTKAENERTGLTAPDAVKVLTAAADDRLGTRWLAAFLLGVRQGERLGLRWSHLDLDVGVADLAWALQRVPYRHGCVPVGDDPTCDKKHARSCPRRELAIPKGMAHKQLQGNLCLLKPKTKGSTRVVAVIEPLRLALLRRQKAVAAERPGYIVDHDLVWCTEQGRPLDPRDDWEDWGAALTAAGVDHVTGHEARHTTATLLLEAGTDPRVVQEILGHTEAATSEGYKHVSVALQRNALDRLGAKLGLTSIDGAA